MLAIERREAVSGCSRRLETGGPGTTTRIDCAHSGYQYFDLIFPFFYYACLRISSRRVCELRSAVESQIEKPEKWLITDGRICWKAIVCKRQRKGAG